jgi:hypothetical protein
MRLLKRAGGRPLAVMLAERRLEQLFLTAYDAKDYAAALKVEEARCRLLGLFPGQDAAGQFAPGPVRPDLQPKPKPIGTTATPAGR